MREDVVYKFLRNVVITHKNVIRWNSWNELSKHCVRTYTGRAGMFLLTQWPVVSPDERMLLLTRIL